jgi:hypothetical protein
MIGDVALVFGRIAGVAPVLRLFIERPRPAARHQEKSQRRSKHRSKHGSPLGPVVQPLDPDLRPARLEIEDRAVPDIDASRHPEIGEGVDVGAPDQRGHHALVGDDDRKRTRLQVGRNRRAVP